MPQTQPFGNAAQTPAKPSDPGQKADDQNASAAAPVGATTPPAPGATASATTVGTAVTPLATTPQAMTPLAQATPLRTSSLAERVQVVNQVAQQIQALHGANAPQARTVTMQLHPEQWGPVTISVTTHGAADGSATVSALVTTAHADAQTLLRQNSQDLKDALSSAGLRLDKLDVQTATVVAASAGHSADAQQQGQRNPQGNWPNAPQDGAGAQAGSHGGGQRPAPGQGQSQRQTPAPAGPEAIAAAGQRTASAAPARAGNVDLHA